MDISISRLKAMLPSWPRPTLASASRTVGLPLDRLDLSEASRSLREKAQSIVKKGTEWANRIPGFDPITIDVTRDPAHANSSPDSADARRRVAQNQPAVARALATLSASDAAAYQTVATRIAHDPEAQHALQTLLLDGRLPGAKDLVAGKTLLQNLATLSQQAVAKGIDQGPLVADLIQEVADPSCIAQRRRATCGPTTAQILLARQNPSEYTRIVSGLASPAGTVQIKSGHTLSRKPDWDLDTDGGRTASSRLVQPAFMEHANGFFTYSNEKDGRNVLGFNLAGVFNKEMDRLVEDLTGRSYRVRNPIFNPLDRLKVFDELKTAGPGREMPICMNFVDEKGELSAGHVVLVVGYKDGKYQIVNPWGREEQITERDMRTHLWGAVIPKN